MIAHLLFFALFYIAGLAHPQPRGLVGLSIAPRGELAHRSRIDPSSVAPSTHRARRGIHPDIEYSYTVDGVSYTSTRITFGAMEVNWGTDSRSSFITD